MQSKKLLILGAAVAAIVSGVSVSGEKETKDPPAPKESPSPHEVREVHLEGMTITKEQAREQEKKDQANKPK
jgi:hypothetical protein